MKVLVLGSRGQLGQCLNDQLVNTNHDVIYTSRDQINISNFKLTKKQIGDIAPDIVINATAYTAVDKAEEDKEMANVINHLAVSNIASICHKLDCWLIHFSTDYVFDGTSSMPYKEDDQTNPQGVYGLTKLLGEKAIKSSACKYIIIRTAWVFSEYGNNFLKTMLRLGAELDHLSIVDDQVGAPTYAQDIAKAITSLLTDLSDESDCQGIYHYCGDTPCSWFEFASEIFNQAKLLEYRVPESIKAVKTSQYPTLAKRPIFSVLDNRKGFKKFKFYPSNWKKSINTVLLKL